MITAHLPSRRDGLSVHIAVFTQLVPVITPRQYCSTPAPVSAGMGYRNRLQLRVQENISRYVTNHPGGQLSLAIPLWVRAISASQWAVMFCGWKVNAGVARVWWQVNCVILVKHVSYLSG